MSTYIPAATLTRSARASSWFAIGVRTLAVLLGVAATYLLVGGVMLAALGGSWYYVAAGAAYLTAAVYLWRLESRGAWITALALGLTCAWAVFETGFNFWGLFPRILAPTGLAAIALAIAPSLNSDRVLPVDSRLPYGLALASGLLFAIMMISAFMPHGVSTPPDRGASFATTSEAALADWTHYGRSASGTRFAPTGQINRTNVSALKVAWTFQTGDVSNGEEQNVPLQVRDTLYTCSRTNRVSAIDADTGAVKWTFDPKAASPAWQRCRGVGYFAEPSLTIDAAKGDCGERIVLSTIDARLITLDARTGRQCAGFGDQGTVDLKQSMGEVKPGFYFQTSAPTVVRDLVVIGGWVRDNQETGEPSGVVRAFDVRTGALRWAWDLGRPETTLLPPDGETYTRGTPNMWSTPSFDDQLGLIYLPLGNATPDYWGAGRSKESESYSSSVVALDIETGRERWKFQTVHHDIWDYDVGSQPALIDVPDGQGGMTPALLQTTKRGQLFLLNRATGESLTPIEERPVPQSGQDPAEWLSPTQPYPVGMPAIGTEPVSESRMWGMTMFDQMLCRIRFRQLRYEGDFTPPGTTPSLQAPGNYGGFNWGSIAFDPTNQYAYMNDIRLPTEVQLKPHDEIEAIISKTKGIGNRHGPARQVGTPYGVLVLPLMSPLGVPCIEPPFGTMTAVDLKTRKIVWQTPIGTPEDTGPAGLRTGMHMPVGMPTISGPLATGGGLVFFAGTQDFYLRALDAATGAEVWRSRLPVGSSSTPMTYISPKTGKQYVVISAGGASGSTSRGDYVIAYALP